MNASQFSANSKRFLILLTTISLAGLITAGCSDDFIDDKDNTTDPDEAIELDPDVIGVIEGDGDFDFDFDFDGDGDFDGDNGFVDPDPRKDKVYPIDDDDGDGDSDDGKRGDKTPGEDGFYDALTLRAEITAGYSYYYDWSIEKSAEFNSLNLKNGESQEVEYTVTVTPTEMHVDHWVKGHLYITNETELAAEIASTQVLVGSDVVAYLDCGVDFPYVLDRKEELACVVEATQLTGDESTVDIEVLPTERSLIDGVHLKKGFEYTEARKRKPTFYMVTVRDLLNGKGIFEETCTADAACTFLYTKTFSCPQNEGLQYTEVEIVETGDYDTEPMEVFCRTGKYY